MATLEAIQGPQAPGSSRVAKTLNFFQKNYHQGESLTIRFDENFLVFDSLSARIRGDAVSSLFQEIWPSKVEKLICFKLLHDDNITGYNSAAAAGEK